MKDQTKDDPYAMRKPCGDCAFDPHSDAGRCDLTVATAMLCVMSGEPFYCHRADKDGDIQPRTDRRGEAVLCRGFVDAFVARVVVEEWRVAVAAEALRILEDGTGGRIASDEEVMDRIIVAGERALMAEDM